MKIAIYNQQHPRAGQVCNDEELIERESQDIMIFEGMKEEAIKPGQSWAEREVEGPNDLHMRKCGRTLLEEAENG